MYMVLVWDDELLDYRQERDEANKPVKFDSWEDANTYIYQARANEIAHGLAPRQRRPEYRTVNRKGRKRG
jgi:hypothetical protein